MPLQGEKPVSGRHIGLPLQGIWILLVSYPPVSLHKKGADFSAPLKSSYSAANVMSKSPWLTFSPSDAYNLSMTPSSFATMEVSIFIASMVSSC